MSVTLNITIWYTHVIWSSHPVAPLAVWVVDVREEELDLLAEPIRVDDPLVLGTHQVAHVVGDQPCPLCVGRRQFHTRPEDVLPPRPLLRRVFTRQDQLTDAVLQEEEFTAIVCGLRC